MTENQTLLIPVLDRLRFDEAGLDRYVRSRLGDFPGRVTVQQFSQGQSNPTYLVTAGDRRYVLRRKPPGHLLPSAHQVEREYQAMTALRDSGVPVPRTYALCEDPAVIGTAFYLMEYVDGRVFPEPTLPGISVQDRAAIFDQAIPVMARLHQVDYARAGLADFGRAGNYFARQVSRWSRQYRASETERMEAMERLMEWLPSHIPEGDETTIVHGDYRLHNMVIHPTEPRIVALLDWELSTLGHPLADLAWYLRVWRIPSAIAGIQDADLKALGIGSEQEYVAAYCRWTGRKEIPNWDFYMAFGLFRNAAIVQGITARALAGNASSDDALTVGARARGLADAGWRVAQGIGG